MWGEAVDTDIGDEPNSEITARNPLTSGKLSGKCQFVKAMWYKCVSHRDHSVPPVHLTHQSRWERDPRSRLVENVSRGTRSDRRHTSVSAVFGVLQLIRQEPKHTRGVRMTEIDVIEQVRPINNENCRDILI